MLSHDFLSWHRPTLAVWFPAPTQLQSPNIWWQPNRYQMVGCTLKLKAKTCLHTSTLSNKLFFQQQQSQSEYLHNETSKVNISYISYISYNTGIRFQLVAFWSILYARSWKQPDTNTTRNKQIAERLKKETEGECESDISARGGRGGWYTRHTVTNSLTVKLLGSYS